MVAYFERLKPLMKRLQEIAHSSSDESEAFVLWQLNLLSDHRGPPPMERLTCSWESDYFLELAGVKQYSMERWRRAAAQALQGILSDDGALRTHLYNFTHAVFYGSDFGKIAGFRVVPEDEVLMSSLATMLQESQEWDLYYEVSAASAMTGNLSTSWIIDIASCESMPGQSPDGWIASSPAEQALLRKHGEFEARYAAVHTTLAGLLAVSIASAVREDFI